MTAYQASPLRVARHRGFDHVNPCDVLDCANSSSMIGGRGGFSGGFAVVQTLVRPPTSSVSLPATVSCLRTLSSSIEKSMQYVCALRRI